MSTSAGTFRNRTDAKAKKSLSFHRIVPAVAAGTSVNGGLTRLTAAMNNQARA